MNTRLRITAVLTFFVFAWLWLANTLFAQSPQVLMQGWYWDYPKTATGNSWADTLRLKAQALKNAGISHVWFPPHTVASFGTNSNGYDPKDLFIGNQTTGLGTRPALDAMLQTFTTAGITPVADMIYNHRDGGRPEANAPVKNYVTTGFNGQNSSNPYPSDRYRVALPIGASTGNGAQTYYIKVSSKTGNYGGKAYQAFFWTGKRGAAVQSTIGETKPNGGGDCSQAGQPAALNQVINSTIPSSGCGTVEFTVTLNATDFNASADSLYMSFVNPNGNYGDQRVYGLWNGSQDVVGQLIYQTYTNFVNMPSTPTGTITIGGNPVNVNGNYNNFKPNDNNAGAGGLTGDWDSMPFFYDYDQVQSSSDNTASRVATTNLLNNWTFWNYETLGVRGLRMDAVKNFPPYYVSQLMNNLQATSRVPNLVVGEFWDGTGNIKSWIDNVQSNMTTAAKAAIQVKAFDFPLRYALRDACDDNSSNARNIIFNSLNRAGVSGFNVVTFANNHDFRDGSGGNSLIRNNTNLAYAYLLTNNQLGVPAIFYPDYYGYPAPANGQYSYHPTGLPAYKSEIDRLLNVLKTYITGSAGVSYLNDYGGAGNAPGSNASFNSGNPNRALIYQLSGTGTASGKDVIVAINFDTSPLRVNHKISIQNTVAQGTVFADVLGRSNFPTAIVNNDAGITNSIYIDLPAKSYSVWVQSALPLSATLASTTVCAGQSNTLTAAASGGTAPYTYQFSTGTTAISGSSSAVTASTAGPYSVTVTDALGLTATATVTSTLNASPSNASLTSGTLTCATTSVTLTASATGGTSYTLNGGTGPQTNTTGVFVVSIPGGYTVTVSNASGCTATATAMVVQGAETQLTWTGSTSTDWNTASNWCPVRIPLSTDDVVIPSAPANQPVLSTTAVAKSVEVRIGASFTITIAGSLTVYSSKAVSGTVTSSFYNGGTVINSGGLILSNPVSVANVGLENRGAFTNNAGGQVRIDRTSFEGVITYGGSSITNSGTLAIGPTTSVGLYGIYHLGTLVNNVGGLITIDQVTSTGFYNIGGNVTNSGTMAIGKTGAIGFYGLFSQSPFHNTIGGLITIDRTGTGALYNRTTFNNEGSIIIGAIAPVGGTGVLNQEIASWQSVFLNNGCSALLKVVSNATITNQGSRTFVNTGTIIENATGNSIISNNAGIIQNLNGGSFSVTTGNPPLSISATNPTSCTPANGSLTLAGLQANTTYALSYTVGGNATTVSPAPVSDANGQFTVGNLGGGVYNVALSGSCVAETLFMSATLTSPANPTLSISPSSATLTCAGPTVSLTAVGSGTVRWDDNSTNAVRSVSSAGTYSVTLTSANGCVAVATATVTNNTTAPTNASLTSGTLTCTATSVTLTASATGGTSYTLNGGTGPQTNTTGVFVVSTAGNYTVTISGTNGCTAVATATVTNNSTAPTNASLTSGTLTCTNTSVTLTASATGGTSYTLNGGTGPQTNTTGVFVVSTAGNYTVTISGTNGCTAVATATVTNNSTAPTNASLTSGTLTCTNTSVTLTASATGGTSYTLNGGTGPQSNMTGVFVVSTAGNYTVTISGANGCTATATATVTNNTTAPTNASLTSGTLTCSATSVTLTASATGGSSYTLNGGTGPQTNTTGVFVVSTAGNYTVTISGANGCTATATSSVVSNTTAPTATLTASSNTACSPTAITLTAAGTGTSYTFSAGATQIGMTNQAIVTQSGTYSVTVSNASGCTATASVSVTVNTPPAAPTLTAVSRTVNANNTPLPLGQFVSAPGTLSFSGVSGVIANPPTANISTAGVQSFSVTQTDANGCTSSATPFSITVLPPIPGNQTACRSSAVVLNAITTGVRYEWYKNGQTAPFKMTEIASIQKGTATSSLTLVSIQTTASYYCKVFQANGESTPGSFTFDGPFVVTVNYGCVAPGARVAAELVAEVPLSVVLTPNPIVDGQLRAVVRGAAGQSLSVQLIDLRGQVVRAQQWAEAESDQVIEWNISQQPSGVYLLRTQTDNQRVIIKVIKP